MKMCSAARAIRRAFGALTLAFAVTAVGCGSGTATVSGTVKYNGEALPSGSVVVHGADGQTAVGTIQDGNYTVDKAPTGDVKIAVQVQDPKNLPQGGGGNRMGPAGGGKPDAFKGGPAGQGEHAPNTAIPAGKVVSIPPKYADPAQSGLATTLKKGKNEFNIDLK